MEGIGWVLGIDKGVLGIEVAKVEGQNLAGRSACSTQSFELRSKWAAEGGCPHISSAKQIPRDEAARNDKPERVRLREFQGYEFCRGCAGVGDGVGVVAGEPFGVSGFEVAGHGSAGACGGVTLHVAADVKVGDGDQEVRAGVVVRGDDAAGLEFEFGGADAIFDEEDLFGAVGKDVEAAVFIPVGGGFAESFVVENFYGDIAEGVVVDVAGDVGEGSGGKVGVAILKFDSDGRLVFDGVDDFDGAEGNVDVVVAVPVHKSVGVRSELDVEDADGFVFESEVMVGLGGDFDFGGLGGEQGCDEAEEYAFHRRIVALRGRG